LSKEDWAAAMREMDEIVAPIAEAFRRGIPPQAQLLDPAIARHRDWISWAWGTEATPEAYAGLADVYEHPDFVARFDQAGAGFTAYLTAAMRSWAKRQ
jgi:MerR family transcriptional regulator, thiopeptide resistance regulator